MQNKFSYHEPPNTCTAPSHSSLLCTYNWQWANCDMNKQLVNTTSIWIVKPFHFPIPWFAYPPTQMTQQCGGVNQESERSVGRMASQIHLKLQKQRNLIIQEIFISLPNSDLISTWEHVLWHYFLLRMTHNLNNPSKPRLYHVQTL